MNKTNTFVKRIIVCVLALTVLIILPFSLSIKSAGAEDVQDVSELTAEIERLEHRIVELGNLIIELNDSIEVKDARIAELENRLNSITDVTQAENVQLMRELEQVRQERDELQALVGNADLNLLEENRLLRESVAELERQKSESSKKDSSDIVIIALVTFGVSFTAGILLVVFWRKRKNA